MCRALPAPFTTTTAQKPGGSVRPPLSASHNDDSLGFASRTPVLGSGPTALSAQAVTTAVARIRKRDSGWRKTICGMRNPLMVCRLDDAMGPTCGNLGGGGGLRRGEPVGAAIVR